jgi:hypothetical protein
MREREREREREINFAFNMPIIGSGTALLSGFTDLHIVQTDTSHCSQVKNINGRMEDYVQVLALVV